MALSLNEQNGNRRKTYLYAGYYYAILDGLAKDDKLKDKNDLILCLSVSYK